VDAPASRVENRSVKAWGVAMGHWVAGEILIQKANDRAEIARLRREGETFVLETGQAIVMTVRPTRGLLALQVAFRPVDGTGGSANIFISQGNPGDQHTLNVNDSPSVQVDKGLYGRSAAGPFVLIR
jgi:hypothetical protein